MRFRRKLYIAGVFTLASAALTAIPKVANFISDQIVKLIPDKAGDDEQK